jgi:hypothetical protein
VNAPLEPKKMAPGKKTRWWKERKQENEKNNILLFVIKKN